MKAVLLFVALLLGSPPAQAFGISFGAPLEERVGGDYGPEYYRALQAKRCHSVRVRTRHGVRHIRRCD
jgi:hypothetical protein